MEEKVLVTGATGFIGCAVARQLAARGARLRVLVRPGSPRRQLDGLAVEWAEGDLRDAAAVERAMQGIDLLFHVAADYRLSTRRSAEMFASNVEGTRNAMMAARRAGVRRIVHTSSVATLAPRPDGQPADESRPQTEAEAIGAYKRSKIAAERLVEAMAAEGLPVVIVNPSMPIGPRDIRPTPTGRIVLEAGRGRMPFYIDTGLNIVHVEDVAAGHLLAAERGRIGERYILGGEDVLLGELLAEVARLCGRRPRGLRIPRLLAWPVAAVSELSALVTGREPFATLAGVAMARQRLFFSSARAAAELGYRARPWQQAVADAVAWFRAEGRL